MEAKDETWSLFGKVEDHGEDLNKEVIEPPNHVGEFDADCFSQTTRTSWSGGLTLDDPFAAQLEAVQAQMVHQVDGEEPEGVQEEDLQHGDGILHDGDYEWGEFGGNPVSTSLPILCRDSTNEDIYENPVNCELLPSPDVLPSPPPGFEWESTEF